MSDPGSKRFWCFKIACLEFGTYSTHKIMLFLRSFQVSDINAASRLWRDSYNSLLQLSETVITVKE